MHFDDFAVEVTEVSEEEEIAERMFPVGELATEQQGVTDVLPENIPASSSLWKDFSQAIREEPGSVDHH